MLNRFLNGLLFVATFCFFPAIGFIAMKTKLLGHLIGVVGIVWLVALAVLFSTPDRDE